MDFSIPVQVIQGLGGRQGNYWKDSADDLAENFTTKVLQLTQRYGGGE